MSFTRYPKYKESGVEWIGPVPEHWSVKKISHVADLIAGFAFPSDKFGFEPECGIPLVRGDNVTEGWLRWGEKGRYWPFGLDYDRRYLLEVNDIVVQMDGSKVGKNWAFVEEVNLPALLVQRVTRVRVKSALPRFIFALIANEMFVRYVDRAKTDPAIPHITMKDIGDYWLPLPSAPEQAAIAAFLARETAKIDALVAEQQRLIELLKEKRQAVISHAVTKGLNPDAPMKPSGIEWLGRVPEHWEMMKLRRCASSVQTGRTPSFELPGNDIDGLMDWYTPGDFGEALRLAASSRRISSAAIEAGEVSVFPPNSVLIVSIGATLGKVGFAQLPSSANQQINAVIPSERVDGYFLAYSLQAKSEVMRFLSNASTIGIMNQEKTKDIWIALPPRREQLEISAFLDAQTDNLDTLTTEAQRAIDLLQERRTALISAAVTGQIDVRGLASESAA